MKSYLQENDATVTMDQVDMNTFSIQIKKKNDKTAIKKSYYTDFIAYSREWTDTHTFLEAEKALNVKSSSEIDQGILHS